MNGQTTDPPARPTLDYVRSIPKDEPCRSFELLSGEKADWESIDYVYRAILAQEERERQQAASEG